MSAPSKDRPTAILIRSGEQSGRPWYRRRRNVLALVGLVLIPGTALAAALFFWGSFAGSTATVNNTAQVMRIASVTGTVGPEGVDCSQSAKIDDKSAALKFATDSLTIAIGSAADNTPSGEAAQIQTGTCTVTVLVENNGPRNVKSGVQLTGLPTGWTATAAPVDIPKESQRPMIVTVSAGTGATSGTFSGRLSLELLPAA